MDWMSALEIREHVTAATVGKLNGLIAIAGLGNVGGVTNLFLLEGTIEAVMDRDI